MSLGSPYRFLPVYLAIVLAGCLPVLLPQVWQIIASALEPARPLLTLATVLLPALVVLLACRALRRAGEPAVLALVFAGLAAVLEYVHYMVVDRGSYFTASAFRPNLQWQIWMHGKVLALAPDVLPHSYRFLPNGLVALLEGLTGDFFLAKSVYRFVFGFGLLCVLYSLARCHVARFPAVLAVILYSAICPVGMFWYAGQLTDPLSHFSFLLAVLFIRRDRDFDFTATLLVGLLAKESIFVVLGCWLVAALRHRAIVPALTRGALIASLALALVLAVRFFVVQGEVAYDKVSGVGLAHIATNLADRTWPPQLLFSIGIFLPIFIVHWPRLPTDLVADILVLLPVLLLSSLLFSWLAEARNFMPVTALLCVATACFLDDWLARDPAREEDENAKGLDIPSPTGEG